MSRMNYFNPSCIDHHAVDALSAFPDSFFEDAEDVRTCRECGCDDMHACVVDGVPCHWVEEDLCSACATQVRVYTETQAAAFLRERGGAL